MSPVITVNFGNVSAPYWAEAYLVGGGPSLKDFDFRRLRSRTVVAVNDAAIHIPWATALFSLDPCWIGNRRALVDSFAGERYLAVAEDFSLSNPPRATYLRRVRSAEGLSDNPYCVHMGGGNSGFGAFNLAYLKRARRLILLGYDFTHSGSHWHSGYAWGGRANDKMYWNWGQQFTHCLKQLKLRGVEVLNASPISTIEVFPRVPLEALPLVELR